MTRLIAVMPKSGTVECSCGNTMGTFEHGNGIGPRIVWHAVGKGIKSIPRGSTRIICSCGREQDVRLTRLADQMDKDRFRTTARLGLPNYGVPNDADRKRQIRTIHMQNRELIDNAESLAARVDRRIEELELQESEDPGKPASGDDWALLREAKSVIRTLIDVVDELRVAKSRATDLR